MATTMASAGSDQGGQGGEAAAMDDGREQALSEYRDKLLAHKAVDAQVGGEGTKRTREGEGREKIQIRRVQRGSDG